MPNWAFGYVNVTGTRDGIKSFIERFVSEDDPSTIPGKRFFARSFIQSKRQAFIQDLLYSSFAGFLKRELGKFAPAQEHPV